MSLVLLGFLGLTGVCVAGEERDGNWWRQQNQLSKTVYVIGLMDGSVAVSGLESARMTPEDFTAHRANVATLIGKARAGQVVEGLDLIYNDFRNRNIPVAKAFWTVTMAINGIPLAPDRMEKQRQDAASR